MRTFVHTSRAWYASALQHSWQDEIVLQTEEPRCELAVRWYDLRNGEQSPRLEMYLASAQASAYLADVFAAWASVSAQGADKTFTPERCIRLLQDCGFTDVTEYLMIVSEEDTTV